MTRKIPQIDKDITAVRKELRRLENIDTMSAASWQDAWDKHPDLRERERVLFVERGIAQQVRDEAEHKAFIRTGRSQNAKLLKELAAKFKAERAVEKAAPALLAALKRMVAAYEADKQHGIAFGNDQAADQARAAITLAMG